MRRDFQRPASLVLGTSRSDYYEQVYTLYLGNGGISGSGYLDNLMKILSPCNSEVHSTLSFGQGSHLFPALWAAGLACTRPLQRI
jgi:hypothetical protein